MSSTVATGVGPLLRTWRERRHLSQLDVSGLAGVSTRHLSYVETGRSRPSRELVLLLAETLEVPLRDRNPLLMAAGYAPLYRETPWDHPDLAGTRERVERYLGAMTPWPAVAVDRGWNLLAANGAAALLLDGVDPALLGEPNVVRIALHPRGLQPRIGNFAEVAAEVVGRLRRQALITADAEVEALVAEVEAYPGVPPTPVVGEGPGEVFIPVRLAHPAGELALVSAITTFGTAVDLTLAELSIETFLPGDDHTAAVLAG